MLELIFALLLALRHDMDELTSIAPGDEGSVDTVNPQTGKGVVFHAFGSHYEIVSIEVRRAPSIHAVPPPPGMPALEPGPTTNEGE